MQYQQYPQYPPYPGRRNTSGPAAYPGHNSRPRTRSGRDREIIVISDEEEEDEGTEEESEEEGVALDPQAGGSGFDYPRAMSARPRRGGR